MDLFGINRFCCACPCLNCGFVIDVARALSGGSPCPFQQGRCLEGRLAYSSTVLAASITEPTKLPCVFGFACSALIRVPICNSQVRFKLNDRVCPSSMNGFRNCITMFTYQHHRRLISTIVASPVLHQHHLCSTIAIHVIVVLSKRLPSGRK